MARRLGLLGPIIVAVGAAAAALGVWFMLRSKPTPGEVIDSFQIDDAAKLVVRREAGGDRAFVELIADGKQQWQAYVPRYAGRPGVPGIAWSETAVSIRVVRDDRAEVFAVSLRDSTKLGGIHLAGEHGKIKLDAPGPITLTDHVRSYELIAGEGWTQMVAIDLRIGTPLWKIELGAVPVEAGGVERGYVWIEQAGKRRWFRVFTGKEDRSMELIGPPPTGGVAPSLPPGTRTDEIFEAPDKPPVLPSKPS